MFLVGTGEDWRLKEITDFKRFKIVLSGVSTTTAPNLRGLEFDGTEYAWIDPSTILDMAGPVADSACARNLTECWALQPSTAGSTRMVASAGMSSSSVNCLIPSLGGASLSLESKDVPGAKF